MNNDTSFLRKFDMYVRANCEGCETKAPDMLRALRHQRATPETPFNPKDNPKTLNYDNFGGEEHNYHQSTYPPKHVHAPFSSRLAKHLADVKALTPIRQKYGDPATSRNILYWEREMPSGRMLGPKGGWSTIIPGGGAPLTPPPKPPTPPPQPKKGKKGSGRGAGGAGSSHTP